jgi:hypothetical protein
MGAAEAADRPCPHDAVVCAAAAQGGSAQKLLEKESRVKSELGRWEKGGKKLSKIQK